jgi:hypothetical protein
MAKNIRSRSISPPLLTLSLLLPSGHSYSVKRTVWLRSPLTDLLKRTSALRRRRGERSLLVRRELGTLLRAPTALREVVVILRLPSRGA